MPVFETFLSLWVALCSGAGTALGSLVPGVFGALAAIEAGQVDPVVALPIWAMVYPMMMIAWMSHPARASTRDPRGSSSCPR